MQYQEFTDARALRLHYQKVRARLTAPRPSLAAASSSTEQRAETREVPTDEWGPLRDEAESQIRAANGGRVNVRQFVADFAEAHGFTYAAIVSDSRTQPLTMYRQDCMLALKRARPDLSYPAIGRAFGGRDHTTVMHGVRQAIRREEHEAGE